LLLTAINVQPHPVEFLVANPTFFDASLHNVPPNCKLDLEVTNTTYICTGDGRPYNYMEWILTMKPGKETSESIKLL
jgi:hypothetical protein